MSSLHRVSLSTDCWNDQPPQYKRRAQGSLGLGRMEKLPLVFWYFTLTIPQVVNRLGRIL